MNHQRCASEYKAGYGPGALGLCIGPGQGYVGCWVIWALCYVLGLYIVTALSLGFKVKVWFYVLCMR